MIEKYFKIIIFGLSIVFTFGILYNKLEQIELNSKKALELSHKNSLDIEYIKGILNIIKNRECKQYENN